MAEQEEIQRFKDGFAIVLYQGGEPPLPLPDVEVDERPPHTVAWDVPDLDYGQPLSDVPAAVVATLAEGDAPPVYRPERGDRRPGFGDHTLSVTIPGNATHRETTVHRSLHVRRVPLSISAQPVSAVFGDVPPEVVPIVEGLVVGDRLEIVFESGRAVGVYGLTPAEVGFVDGVAQNYAITVGEGTLTIQPRPLTIRPVPAIMEAGSEPPEIMARFEGLVPGDEASAEVLHDVDVRSPVNMPGYPTRVGKVTFTRGAAENYAITHEVGALSVRPSSREIEEKIGVLRRRIVALEKKQKEEWSAWQKLDEPRPEPPTRHDIQALYTLLDSIIADRFALRYDEVARTLDQLERDVAIYIPVAEVIVTPESSELVLDPIQLALAVEPANATHRHVTWAAEPSGLVAVAHDGTVSRVGREGGTVVITATSSSGPFGSCRVAVAHLPTAIVAPTTIEALSRTPRELQARVEPPEASQEVEWRLHKRRPPNWLTLSGGTVTVSGSSSGTLQLEVRSVVDPRVLAVVDLHFKQGVESVFLEPKRLPSDLDVDTPFELEASTYPADLSEVRFSLRDPEQGTLVQKGMKATFTALTAGTHEIRATATDGSGKYARIVHKIPVEIEGFDITAPGEPIDIGATPRLTCRFTPANAFSRASWKSSNPQVAKIDDDGVLHPTGLGTTTIEARLSDGDLAAKTVQVTVTASESSAIPYDQISYLRERIVRFAKRIGIVDNPFANEKFEQYLHIVTASARQGEVITLKKIDGDLRKLRNAEVKFLHGDWLAQGDFSGGNCMIRNDTTIAIEYPRGRGTGTQTCKIHLTMFPMGLLLEVGDDFERLRKRVFREGNRELKSLHATLVVNPDQELKSFVNGTWTPAWETTVTWPRGFRDAAQSALDQWRIDNMDRATEGLEAAFDAIKENDGDTLW